MPTTLPSDLTAILVALLALYGVGLPVALLLPAPDRAPWVHRIAVAPMLAIALAYPIAMLFRGLSIRLHPGQLLALLLLLWTAAVWRRRSWWSGPDARSVAAPAALVGAAAVTWTASLWTYGLYLPNRDFKNHALFVAEVADSGSAAFTGYPLGLHTLLGWALPTTQWSSVGVTAGAAVLSMTITLPLAMVTLGRMWAPGRESIAVLAGLMVVLLPGSAGAFGIGSVPMLVGTACYAAASGSLWLWLRQPTPGTSAGLILCWSGLLFLHVAEAVALGLVLVPGLVALLWRRRGSLDARGLAVIGACAGGIALLGYVYLRPNMPILANPAAWDVEPDVFGVVTAAVVTSTKAVTTEDLTGILWLPFVAAGLWLGYRERLSPVPLLMLGVPLFLAIIAGGPWVPDWLRPLSAPWYGAIGRVAYLAAPPVVLLGSLSLASLLQRARESRRPVLGLVGALILGLAVAVPAQGAVTQRRDALSATLAGAGNTPQVAEDLARRLLPGETVLVFEGDGGAQLFSMARVPLAGQWLRLPLPDPATDPAARAILGLADVGSPSAAAAMAELGVRYVVVGTTSIYWDLQVGVALDQLLEQPEFTLVADGSDLVVLHYQEVPR